MIAKNIKKHKKTFIDIYDLPYELILRFIKVLAGLLNRGNIGRSTRLKSLYKNLTYNS